MRNLIALALLLTCTITSFAQPVKVQVLNNVHKITYLSAGEGFTVYRIDKDTGLKYPFLMMISPTGEKVEQVFQNSEFPNKVGKPYKANALDLFLSSINTQNNISYEVRLNLDSLCRKSIYTCKFDQNTQIGLYQDRILYKIASKPFEDTEIVLENITKQHASRLKFKNKLIADSLLCMPNGLKEISLIYVKQLDNTDRFSVLYDSDSQYWTTELKSKHNIISIADTASWKKDFFLIFLDTGYNLLKFNKDAIKEKISLIYPDNWTYKGNDLHKLFYKECLKKAGFDSCLHSINTDQGKILHGIIIRDGKIHVYNFLKTPADRIEHHHTIQPKQNQPLVITKKGNNIQALCFKGNKKFRWISAKDYVEMAIKPYLQNKNEVDGFELIDLRLEKNKVYAIFHNKNILQAKILSISF